MKYFLPRILILLASLVLVTDGARSQVDLARDAASHDESPALSPPDTSITSPDDIYWDDRFTIDSLHVTAIAAHRDELYICGDFTSIGGVPARYIAIWNKRTKEWSALGSGLNRPAAALAVQGDDLYVGGRFVTAGGDSTGPIARWSISERRWYRLPALPVLPRRATVTAIAVDSAELYVATLESQSPDSGSSRMLVRMKLGGDSWEVLPGDVKGYQIPYLGLMGEYLYAAGPFGSIADVPGTRRVARWNRRSGLWSALGSSAPISGGDGRVLALAVGNGSVYIGGSFDSVETAASRCIARWDTATKAWQDGGIAGRVTALAATGDSLFVGGTFKIRGDESPHHFVVYDPRAWREGPRNTLYVVGSRFDHIALSGNDLYIAGNVWRAENTPLETIGHYTWGATTSAWEGLPIRLGRGIESDGAVEGICVAGTKLCVMGSYMSRAGTIDATGLATFDGEYWAGVGSPLNRPLTAIACFGGWDSVIYVAWRPSTENTGLAFWDAMYERFNQLPIWGSITAIVRYGAEIWCAGDLRLSPDDTTRVTVASWDGLAWTARKGDGIVTAMVATATDLYIGGTMPDPDGWPGSGLARWDGLHWRSVGGGISGNSLTVPAHVTALAVRGRDLYVAGEFIQEGSRGIARWDGTASAWRGLGRGLTRPGRINALAIHGRMLYAAGGFDSFTNGGPGVGDSIHAVATRNIARWDESTGQWSALGSGTDDTVRALAVLGNDLYAVGDFMRAGGKPSARIARWRDPSPSASVPGARSDAASRLSLRSVPNPATTTTRIGFTLDVPSTLRLTIAGSDGREVARPVEGRFSAGEHEVTWDTRSVPAGVYFYTLRCGDLVETVSITVVH
jgi:hypothetical protein